MLTIRARRATAAGGLCVWTAAVVGGACALSRPAGPAAEPDAASAAAREGGASAERAAREVCPVGHARAFRIERDGQLPEGGAVAARRGDIRLDNERLVAVIDQLGGAQGFSQSGGNLVDLAADGAPELLGQSFLYLDATFPRQAIYTQLEIVEPGGDGASARVRASGHDSANPALEIVTEYVLAPGADAIGVVTTVRNTGTALVPAYEVGDVLQWGRFEHFTPGGGLVYAGKPFRASWVAGVAPGESPGSGASIGLVASSGEFAGFSGNSWTDVVGPTADLAPEAEVVYRRWFVTGGRDAASVGAVALHLRGERAATVSGVVREDGGLRGVPGVRVWLAGQGGEWRSMAVTAADGAFQAVVPPGVYHLTARAGARGATREADVQIPADGSVTVPLLVSRPGELAVTAEDAAGGALPVKLTIAGVPPTVDPELGPLFSGAGSGPTVLAPTGAATVELPPGNYRVYVSRGMEWSLWEGMVTIAPDETTRVKAVLRREVDTTGWLSADFHQHASPGSFDSGTSMRDRVLQNLVEGVEVIAGTDHNTFSDYGPVVEAVGAGRWLRAFRGVEVTTHHAGHFGAFPLAAGGTPPAKDKVVPDALIAAVRALEPRGKLVQLNHARSGFDGYFDAMAFDPRTGESAAPGFTLDFDAMELFNGRRQKMVPAVLRDWYGLLNRGVVFTATANSDTHGIYTYEAGWPRNFLRVGTDVPAELTEAGLIAAVGRQHAVSLSWGPVLDLEIDGAPIGGLAKLPSGVATARVRVQAAGWVDVTEVELVRNGERVARLRAPAREPGAPLDWRTEVTLPVSHDGWVVALARGARALRPVVPPAKGADVYPFALTNPVWLDADGDGVSTPLLPAPSRAPAR